MRQDSILSALVFPLIVAGGKEMRPFCFIGPRLPAACHPSHNPSCSPPGTIRHEGMRWMQSNPKETNDESPETAGIIQDVARKEGNNETPLGRFLRGFLSTGMKEEIELHSIVIAKVDIPSLGIWMDQSYEIQSIYSQGLNLDSNTVEQIPLSSLTATTTSTIKKRPGYTTYIKLYSPVYHKESGSVIVTPEEVGLTSLRNEILDSVSFAIPGVLFWLTTSFVFAKTYNDRYGGDFLDAFFGR